MSGPSTSTSWEGRSGSRSTCVRAHPVGRYWLDLLLTDDQGRVVIVENQFDATDRDHLGELLTYAAGTEADVVIWVAERFNRAPRLAIRLPASPDELDLESPYPTLATSWFPAQGEWGWTVPSADLLPDVTAPVDLADRLHRGGQTASPGVVDAPAAAGANGRRAAASDASRRPWLGSRAARCGSRRHLARILPSRPASRGRPPAASRGRHRPARRWQASARTFARPDDVRGGAVGSPAR